MEVLSMILTVVLMIAVFVGAYYVSKLVGKHYQPRNGISRNMSILECQNVGKDRALLIVKAENKAFLIGSTPHEFTLISELDTNGLVDSSDEIHIKKDFTSVLRSALMGKEKKGEGENK